MIGKILTFISGAITGFVVGLVFGSEIGRWFIDQVINFIQSKI